MQLINSFVANMVARLIDLRAEKHEEGQTLVEYALILALMSIALVGALTLLAGGVGQVYQDIVAAF